MLPPSPKNSLLFCFFVFNDLAQGPSSILITDRHVAGRCFVCLIVFVLLVFLKLSPCADSRDNDISFLKMINFWAFSKNLFFHHVFHIETLCPEKWTLLLSQGYKVWVGFLLAETLYLAKFRTPFWLLNVVIGFYKWDFALFLPYESTISLFDVSYNKPYR